MRFIFHFLTRKVKSFAKNFDKKTSINKIFKNVDEKKLISPVFVLFLDFVKILLKREISNVKNCS